MDFQAAIFDLDGTVIDSQGFWHDTKGYYIERYGLASNEELAVKLDQYELYDTARYIIDNYLPKLTPDKIIGDILDTMRQHYMTDVQPKPGIVDFFRRLHEKGTKVCLGTASRRAIFAPLLERLDIAKYFDCIANTELVARDKHYPDVFIYACGMVGSTVPRSVVFDDALYAAETAKQAGFTVVGIDEPYSHGTAAQMKPVCDLYIPDYLHIPDSFWE